MENWKVINDFQAYEVSDYGRIRRCYKNGKIVIMKPWFNKQGYLQVHLCKNGKHHPKTIHRLVALHFIDNPDNLPQVNHKDECKTNNCVTNLEWCTSQYNLTYGTRIQKAAKTCYKPIKQYDLDGNFIRRWDSITEAAKQLMISQGNLSSCLKGKFKTMGGYKWSYE